MKLFIAGLAMFLGAMAPEHLGTLGLLWMACAVFDGFWTGEFK